MAGHTHFDESLEECLEADYRLEREGPGVTASRLAADLRVAPASRRIPDVPEATAKLQRA